MFLIYTDVAVPCFLPSSHCTKCDMSSKLQLRPGKRKIALITKDGMFVYCLGSPVFLHSVLKQEDLMFIQLNLSVQIQNVTKSFCQRVRLCWFWLVANFGKEQFLLCLFGIAWNVASFKTPNSWYFGKEVRRNTFGNFEKLKQSIVETSFLCY